MDRDGPPWSFERADPDLAVVLAFPPQLQDETVDVTRAGRREVLKAKGGATRERRRDFLNRRR